MKTIIKLFICISLIYTPFLVFAGAAEKWEILENVYDTPKNTVNVTAKKITQDAANSGVYKVKVPVSSSTLGKSVKMMLWAGVAVGAVQGLLEGVGWIIDKGSKVIKRPLPNSTDPNQIIDGVYVCVSNGCSDYPINKDSYYSSLQSAINRFVKDHRGDVPLDSDLQSKVYEAYNQLLKQAVDNPNTRQAKNITVDFGVTPQVSVWAVSRVVIPEPELQYEYLSDTALGNEVKGDGETSGDPSVIPSVYNPNNPVFDAPAPNQTNDALNNANLQPENEPSGNFETEKEKDPATGQETGKEISKFELPNFCAWAPAVCDFFKVQKQDNKEIKENQKEQIAQDKTFFDKVSEWFDWSKEDTDLPDDEKPEIQDLPVPELKEDAIRWSAQCPADAQVPINMQGVSSTITFSWSPWCQLLDMIKPAIIASAYIGAAFIVLGLRT